MAIEELPVDSGFIDRQQIDSLVESEQAPPTLKFSEQQVIEIFNATISQDPIAEKDALGHIKDETLRSIATKAIEGSDQNDRNQTETTIVDFIEQPPLSYYS